MTERLGPAPVFESWQGRVLRGKYRVGRKLGSGGWGAVYEAQHLVLERKVAIKFLHPDVEEEPNARERLRREAIAASRIGHPNIVEVIDLDSLPDGREFIVLELLDGVELSAVLSAQRVLPLVRALPIFTQIADALAAAHRARLVHRDLKPENVLLCKGPTGEEVVKILDFGVAKLRSMSAKELDTFTGTGEVLGTPRYMAPEQVRGDPHLDHRADLHALGLMMYEALAGGGPFDTPDLPAFLGKLLHEVPVPLAVRRDNIPRALSDLVQKLLEKSPANRPKNAEEVHATLLEIAKDVTWSRFENVAAVVSPKAGKPSPAPGRGAPADPSGAVNSFMEKLEAATSTAGSSKSPLPPMSSQTVPIKAQARAPLPSNPVDDQSSVIISIEYLESGSIGAVDSLEVPLPAPAPVPLAKAKAKTKSGAPPARHKRKRRSRSRRLFAHLIHNRTISSELERWRLVALVLGGVLLCALGILIGWFAFAP